MKSYNYDTLASLGIPILLIEAYYEGGEEDETADM